MSSLSGVDTDQLEEKEMRSGAYTTLVPAVRSKAE